MAPSILCFHNLLYIVARALCLFLAFILLFLFVPKRKTCFIWFFSSELCLYSSHPKNHVQYFICFVLLFLFVLKLAKKDQQVFIYYLFLVIFFILVNLKKVLCFFLLCIFSIIFSCEFCLYSCLPKLFVSLLFVIYFSIYFTKFRKNMTCFLSFYFLFLLVF